ncbi:nuclear transport factor 2 family protein [Sphingobium sp. YR768]|uniref:nuclear transport factor 2 family protein n=1 Tax=Sphingobium sp. YR768 TaxID=1884365 RepID=UPI0008D3DA98|nr:nuclear transport factor 2 family protein [Sphingobium sp. YR768]SES21596.1 Ketosteroid isomerase-related protein [Sphingobium sp. YR768]
MEQPARDYLDLGLLDDAEANIEIVRKAYRYMDQNDFDGFATAFADDAVSIDPDGLPYGGVYPGGRVGLLELAQKVFGTYEVFEWDIQQFAGGGDVVFVHILITFKPHGKPAFQHPVVELWRLRDSKVVEFRVFYFDTKLIAEALA